jgi:proton-coupled amino acid transporter
MSTTGEGSSSRPLPVPLASSPGSSRGRSLATSIPRAASTARLASPVPSSLHTGTPTVRQIPTPSQTAADAPGFLTPLAGAVPQSSLPGPGISALAAALSNSIGTSPPRFGTPPLRPLSPATAGQALQGGGIQSNYGSFDTRPRSVQGGSGWANTNAYEDPEVVRRHLVQPSETASQVNDGQTDSIFGGPSMSVRNDSPASRIKQVDDAVAPGLDDDEFSSLRLQGGDITRPIYRWSEEAQARAEGRGRNQRSQSFHLSRPHPEDETLDIGSIKLPGGMRRNYLHRAAPSPSPMGRDEENLGLAERRGAGRPKLFTNNFIEFLTLYGHFAGEELEEDDEALAPNEYFSSGSYGEDRGLIDGEDGSDEDREPMEDSALLTPGRRKRKRKDRGGSGQNTSTGAALLLLKSFVGTGVLFLPRAYLNGGMVFSNVILLFVAALSYYCFVLLVTTRLKVDGSFGDIGGILYGKWMRTVILSSIVLSQIGFVAAYIVFTSENLQAFVLAVSDCKTHIPIKYMILMQMAVFLPFSLLRDISKLAFTALIADALILMGLAYLYYYNILTIAVQGVSDIVSFNKNDWTLFIGTAIFTFEGIGLIIPIQESMRKPKNFPPVLGGVMIIITVVFISMGALSYAAYGSKTETVVILNLPQDDKFVNAVQFMYSLAILLSTPLQIFPAIRILETELFTRSGKYNPYIKWQKNVFRFFIVMLCAAIAWGGAGDLDKFVALVGSFACVPLVYIYPVSLLPICIFFGILTDPQPMLHYKAVAKTRFRKVCDVILCLFGTVVMIYTTSLTVISWATGGGVPETHGGYCDDPISNKTISKVLWG